MTIGKFNLVVVSKLVSISLVLAAVMMLAYAWRAYQHGSGRTVDASTPLAQDHVTMKEVEMLPVEAWSVFRTTTNELVTIQETGRFRLAGTFFVMKDEEVAGEARQRMAILDDLEADQQSIVSEGENLADYEVTRIYADRVILRRSDGQEVELTLSFKEGFPVSEEAKPASLTGEPEQVQDVVLESNRFVRRIGENRWLINKQALLDYYQELLDAPDRIAALYESLRPDYSEDREIMGYILDPVGEREFYEAVGFREGDRVRKVNSMNMTSQRRAEYFISEFMQNRLGAVVIDVERDGQMEKLIYLLREEESGEALPPAP